MSSSSSSSSAMDVVDSTPTTSASSAKTVTFADISKSISYICRGVELNQPRLIQRAIRQNANIRKFVTAPQLREMVTKFIPMTNPVYDNMMAAIDLLPLPPVTSSSASGEEKSSSGGSVPMDLEALAAAALAVPTTVFPEVEVFVFTTIVTCLMREKLDSDAAFVVTVLINRIRGFNRRSLDQLTSKAYFYFSLAYENIQRLENIRPTLLALYRTSCVRRDEMGQAVLLNLLLRNYLHYNLVEQAQTLSLRAAFPENASNNQFCRYLYYMGRVQAIQLEYSDAYQRLMMAVRKAPQETAAGFTRMVYKLAVLVQLLMGDIPERSLFNQVELRAALHPYLFLTQAVRHGSLQQFSKVMEEYGPSFTADKNFSLVQRLGHNVLKTGLRKISVAYSRISMADIASKLQLPTSTAAEHICAKAIRDGVIEATIDHTHGWLLSNDVVDLYSTEEPQKAFHKRIAFCLDVHNEAVKSMRYPPDAYKKKLLAGSKENKDSKDEKSIEELIKEYDEENED